MKFHIISLGCSKNTADSEHLANQFKATGWEWAPKPEKSDLILINTCGFINDAKEESLRNIMEAISLKAKHPSVKLAVFGCLIKRYHKEIEEQIPEIDYLFDFLTPKEITKLCKLAGKDYRTPDYSKSGRFFNPKHLGILKIGEGCNNRCAYCAIPYIRGPYYSLKESDIVKDCENLVASGAKEISVVAQDITRYGTDNDGICKLPRLLKKISAINGVEWIRLHYMHPRGLTPKLIDEIFTIDKVLPYFDIPFQHISAKLIKAMNRHTTPEHMKSLIKHIRKNYPEGIIRTTFIVGFPGEQKRDFDKLIDFIEEYPLDSVCSFIYSPEENTKAYSMTPKVREATKQARLDQLMTLQQLIIEERNKKLIGKQIDVIIDEISKDGIATGRTIYDAYEVDNITTIEKAKGLKPGDIVKVKITDADAYDFKADIIK